MGTTESVSESTNTLLFFWSTRTVGAVRCRPNRVRAALTCSSVSDGLLVGTGLPPIDADPMPNVPTGGPSLPNSAPQCRSLSTTPPGSVIPLTSVVAVALRTLFATPDVDVAMPPPTETTVATPKGAVVVTALADGSFDTDTDLWNPGANVSSCSACCGWFGVRVSAISGCGC